MPVIARDSVAADHLVYAWPFPIGPEEYEVACADDERVVMCPAWVVAGLLGPGRHRWRTPDPTRPSSAFFVLTAPVEVSFDMVTTFVVPSTGQRIRLRGTGSLQVRCSDPGLLIAQFVGLPFDAVNEGILRSVSRSVERMLARLLTRRVVMGGTPAVVTEPAMLPNIIEELIAYNPAAGAVFGIELVRMGHLAIQADDGTQPLAYAGSDAALRPPPRNGDTARGFAASHADIPLLETVRAPRGPASPTLPPPLPPPLPLPTSIPTPIPTTPLPPSAAASGTLTPPGAVPAPVPPPIPPIARRTPSTPPTQVSGEIEERKITPVTSAPAIIPPPPAPAPAPPSAPRRTTGEVEVPRSTDEITQPGVNTPAPGTLKAKPEPEPPQEPRGAILGIGMSHIGSAQVASGEIPVNTASGEIPMKIAPGGRVLVPGPNGLMQSATVRQLLQGYYELEVGGSGETIWVPINGVVPE